MKKSYFIGGILVVSIAFFIGWRLWQQKIAFPTQLEDITVGLSWVHESQFAGEYYADVRGLYREQGLRAHLIPFDGSDLVQKLVSGEYEFAILQGDTLLQARSKGKPVVGIFVTYRLSPTVFFSKEDSGIREPKDFIGKKVAVAYSERIPLISMLKFSGVDESQIQIIDREYSYKPLFEDTYDVEAGWITDLDAVEAAGINNPTSIRPSDYGSNIYADIIVTTEDLIEKRPDLVQQFVTATQKGWEKAAQEVGESSRLTLQYDPSLDKEHLQFVLEESLPLIKPSRGSDIGASAYIEWRKMFEILKEQNFITDTFDVSDAYTTKFLR